MCKVAFFVVIQYHPSETNLKIYILGKFRLMFYLNTYMWMWPHAHVLGANLKSWFFRFLYKQLQLNAWHHITRKLMKSRAQIQHQRLNLNLPVLSTDGLRSFNTGILMMKKKTVYLTPSAVIRLICLIVLLFTLPKTGWVYKNMAW